MIACFGLVVAEFVLKAFESALADRWLFVRAREV